MHGLEKLVLLHELETVLGRHAYRMSQLTYYQELGFNVTHDPEIRDIQPYLHLLNERGLIMARKNGKNVKNNIDFAGFVRSDLGADERENFVTWQDTLSLEQVAQGVIQIVDTGYKLSVGYDKNNDSCFATLTNRDGDSRFRGYALSSFAGDSITALKLMIYKHVVLADGDWEYFGEVGTQSFG